MKSILVILVILSLYCVATTAQQTQPTYPKVVQLDSAPSQTAKPATTVMTVDDLIKLSKAGLSDEVIIQQLKKNGQPFDLFTEQLVQLKSASVSERVIQVMD